MYGIFPRVSFASWLAKHAPLITKWRKANGGDLSVILPILEDAFCEHAIWSSATNWREGWKLLDLDRGMFLSLQHTRISQGVVTGTHKTIRLRRGTNETETIITRHYGWRQLYPLTKREKAWGPKDHSSE